MNDEHFNALEGHPPHEWNKWRLENWDIKPDLRGLEVKSGGNLSEYNFHGADLSNTTFNGTRFVGTNLSHADLRHSRITGANLSFADLTGADLTGAVLARVDLTGAILVRSKLNGASLTDARVYGASVWDVETNHKTKQRRLIITPEDKPDIFVDNLKVAQFMYLLLNNQEIRNVIDTATSKLVLLLGRFTEERKAVLDALRDELRRQDYVPVIFDFDKPMDKSIADTVMILAKLACFVIADITDASWVTVETQIVVRQAPLLPFRLIKHESASVPSAINDLRPESPQLIKPLDYRSAEHAVASVKMILAPAEEMAAKIRLKRRAIEATPW